MAALVKRQWRQPTVPLFSQASSRTDACATGGTRPLPVGRKSHSPPDHPLEGNDQPSRSCFGSLSLFAPADEARGRGEGAPTCIHIVGPPTGLAAASCRGPPRPGVEHVVHGALHLAVVYRLGALGGTAEGRERRGTGSKRQPAMESLPASGAWLPFGSLLQGASVQAVRLQPRGPPGAPQRLRTASGSKLPCASSGSLLPGL